MLWYKRRVITVKVAAQTNELKCYICVFLEACITDNILKYYDQFPK